MKLFTRLEGGYPQSQMTVTASGPHALRAFQIFSRFTNAQRLNSIYYNLCFPGAV